MLYSLIHYDQFRHSLMLICMRGWCDRGWGQMLSGRGGDGDRRSQGQCNGHVILHVSIMSPRCVDKVMLWYYRVLDDLYGRPLHRTPVNGVNIRINLSLPETSVTSSLLMVICLSSFCYSRWAPKHTLLWSRVGVGSGRSKSSKVVYFSTN